MLGEDLVFTRHVRIRVPHPIVAGARTYLAAGEYEAAVSPHGGIARVLIHLGGVHHVYLTAKEFTEVTVETPHSTPPPPQQQQWRTSCGDGR